MKSKLVRDRIPELIRASGKSLIAHVADSTEYDMRLLEKMEEELLEFTENPSAEEAADIYEVFLAILENWNFDLGLVRALAEKKAAQNGKFKFGIVLDEIIIK